MSYKIGFIGGGAMGSAMISGVVANGVFDRENIYVSEHTQAKADILHNSYGVNASVGADLFIDKVNMLILAIKPQVADKAIEEIKGKVSKQTVIASIIAGMTIEKLEAAFPGNPVIRIMPNTPMSVGEGMSAYALGTKASDESAVELVKLLSSCGKVVQVKEAMMDAVTGLSGSGPAYAFLIIDALSDGGVAAGLPRKDAITLAAQTMLGAAKMVLECGKHPDQLRDQVTSPAGTTIAGVRVMEQRCVRGVMIDAVMAATEKSASLGK